MSVSPWYAKALLFFSTSQIHGTWQESAARRLDSCTPKCPATACTFSGSHGRSNPSGTQVLRQRHLRAASDSTRSNAPRWIIALLWHAVVRGSRAPVTEIVGAQ